MTDIKSSKLIVAKGIMFLVIAALCAYLLLEQMPSIRVAVLLAILVWASARFYYFLFYVLERYVDPTMRYSGIFNLLVAIFKKPTNGRSGGRISRDRDP